MSTSSEFPVREQIAKDIRALALPPCTDHSQLKGTGAGCPACHFNEGIEVAARVAEKVPHRDSWVTPDWVMVGVPTDYGTVMVLASTELTGSEFIRETVGMQPVKVPGARRLAQIPQVRNTLVAEIASYQTVYAQDYPSALRDLLSRAGWGEPASAHPREQSLSADGSLLALESPE